MAAAVRKIPLEEAMRVESDCGNWVLPYLNSMGKTEEVWLDFVARHHSDACRFLDQEAGVDSHHLVEQLGEFFDFTSSSYKTRTGRIVPCYSEETLLRKSCLLIEDVALERLGLPLSRTTKTMCEEINLLTRIPESEIRTICRGFSRYFVTECGGKGVLDKVSDPLAEKLVAYIRENIVNARWREGMSISVYDNAPEGLFGPIFEDGGLRLSEVPYKFYDSKLVVSLGDFLIGKTLNVQFKNRDSNLWSSYIILSNPTEVIFKLVEKILFWAV